MKDLNQFFADEKVLAVIDHSRGTSGGGTVFVQSGGSYKPGETTTVPATHHGLRALDPHRPPAAAEERRRRSN